MFDILGNICFLAASYEKINNTLHATDNWKQEETTSLHW